LYVYLRLILDKCAHYFRYEPRTSGKFQQNFLKVVLDTRGSWYLRKT